MYTQQTKLGRLILSKVNTPGFVLRLEIPLRIKQPAFRHPRGRITAVVPTIPDPAITTQASAIIFCFI
ncbi:hypothetical protein DIJ64_07165 [Mycobacterium leprae]|uniref:Uncharacterized protein n=1 Tax=Mycobacterium leprae TaxID=1769 RepID=A0AAD2JEC6_MYCLR|nr:hypothetical protein DIJ64_07165 [Mycobacterium leprae]OAR20074.1 hypothetical protein A8144_12345 [Mycobacterium leprae 3125609]OAX70419.1 hypothetical protein A3216_12015 [Mycobacterium leprae 7935681]